jgi:hypothetical protein
VGVPPVAVAVVVELQRLLETDVVCCPWQERRLFCTAAARMAVMLLSFQHDWWGFLPFELLLS